MRRAALWVVRCSPLRSPIAAPETAAHNAASALRHVQRVPQPLQRPASGVACSRGFAAIAEELPLTTERERVVVLGTGWAAARLVTDLNPKLYDFTVISPRNHMVFTPLLSNACVGTLEPRSVAQPMIRLQPALKQLNNRLLVAEATHVHPAEKVVDCHSEDGLQFKVRYDKLVIATGSQGSTFGIPGVEEHAHFLRDVKDADRIRNHLLTNWTLANIPGRSRVEALRLLTTVVVGGGPTGVEFAGELSDFINKDLRRIDPMRARDSRIELIEASQLLGSFDMRLRQYAVKKLTKAGVSLRRGMVKEVFDKHLVLQDGTEIPYGTCVWSTGVGPTPFTTALPFARTPKGRVAVDEYQRVLVHPSVAADLGSEHDAAANPAPGPGHPTEVEIKGSEQPEEPQQLEAAHDVYALGDCCARMDLALPALAQVAEQQGRYLAKALNGEAKARVEGSEIQLEPFRYKQLGAMASVGGHSAVLELGEESQHPSVSLAGFWSWVAWRSAYLTRLGTNQNRIYVAVNWTMTLLFGRDVSRW